MDHDEEPAGGGAEATVTDAAQNQPLIFHILPSSDDESENLRLLNEFRRDAGLPPLALDEV